MFRETWGDSGVLPTLGTTELLQSKRFGESLLSKGLLGQDGGHTIGSLVPERRVEEDELLNLAEFLQELLYAQPRPHILGLAMQVLEQRDSEHTVEGVNPDLAVGPVMHRPPAQPFAVFETAKHALDLLLAGIPCHHLFGSPVQTVGEQHGAAETLRPQLLQSRMVHLETQMPSILPLLQLVVEDFANK